MHFASDNNSGVCPEVIDAIIAESGGFDAAYGADRRCAELVIELSELFEHEVEVYLVPTGTAANALCLASVNPVWGAVLCGEHSHIVVDECAAPTVIGAGLSLLPLSTDHGKISPRTIDDFLASRRDTGVHSVATTSISVAQVTECGTLYSPSELGELGELARSRDMAFHLDGARFANAVAASGHTPAELSWRSGVDIMSFGATKGGALGAEAIVVFQPERVRDDIARLRKRSGHLLSKQRFVATQFLGWLNDGTWLRLAARANDMATRLGSGLLDAGVRLSHPVDANLVFAWLDEATIDRLFEAGATFYRDNPLPAPDGAIEVRLVASWSTSTTDVERFLGILSGS